MPLPARFRSIARSLVLPVILLLFAGLRHIDDVRRPLTAVEASFEGDVVERGDVPGGAAGAAGLRYWSTWNGSDTHLGRLVIGPFSAPTRFAMLVRGYPGIGNNSLIVENPSTGETIALVSDSNPGEVWFALRVEVPESWHGSPIRIVAVDRAVEWGGWMAVSEPFVSPAWASWWNGIVPRVHAFLLTGASLAVLGLAAFRTVRRLRIGGQPLAWLLTLALVAAAGYLVFWLHFWSASIGGTSAWMLLAVATLSVCASSQAPARGAADRDPDSWVPPALMVALGLVAFGALHLHTVTGRQSVIAAHRLGSLPADNEIPQFFAQRLLEDRSPRALFGDWLSSDRPPLQTGWQLLVARPALAAGHDFDTAMQGAGIWFQLAWIPAVWAWLRRMGLAPGPTALVIVALTPSTFLLLNTIFIWPKLGAAALLLGACLCWFFPEDTSVAARRRHVAGGALAALAWLAHGGVAFAAIPIALWALIRINTARIRPWLLAAAAFALLAGPWIAYQKFYEPPGNRLIKWHLAGQIPPDERGTWEALRDAYRDTPVESLAKARLDNIKTIFAGTWHDLFTFRTNDAAHRRGAESGYTLFALGWWNAGFLALAAFAVAPAWRRKLTRDESRGALAGVLWASTTTLVWAALMFIPGSTLLHQGSYTTVVLFLATLAWALWRLHPVLFSLAAIAQLIGFIRFTLPVSSGVEPRIDAIALIVVATVCAFLVVITTWIQSQDSEARPLLHLRRPSATFLILTGLSLAAITVIHMERIHHPLAAIHATADEGFEWRGAVPGETAPDPTARFWSSWMRNDDSHGSLTVGPFSLPRHPVIFVRGYPEAVGNSIALERVDTGEIVRQRLENPGESWRRIRLQAPADWAGTSVMMRAIDGASGWGGWFALSEPCSIPSWAFWTHGFPVRFAHIAIVALTSALLMAAACGVLARLFWIEPGSTLLLLCGFAAVAIAGLLLFAIGMISPTALSVATWLVLTAAAIFVVRPDAKRTGTSKPIGSHNELPWVLGTMLVFGTFAVAVLHRFETSPVLSTLAQTRFTEFTLPSDNVIPQFLAERLLQGEPARTMFGDWHSSDRPPLQAGWTLILVRPATALGIPYDTAAQAAGIVLQCAAIPAIWMLLRLLGANGRDTTAIILLLAPTGFFLINLTYVWPKLAGGAFTLVAFLLAFMPESVLATPRRQILAGTFAALGWLAHGGVAFSLLAATPWLVAPVLRSRTRWHWLAGATAFLVLAAPWMAYQKLYDPPGNRLLKWHLAGVIPPDDRGTVETLRDSYRDTSLTALASARVENVHSIIRGPWTRLITFAFGDRAARTTGEFFQFAYAFGWWNLGYMALALLWRRGRIGSDPNRHEVRLLGWVAGTLAVWVLLMFIPGSTVIHQGSYVPLLVLFPLLAFALLRVHPLLFGAIAFAQVLTFAWVWFPAQSSAPLVASHTSAAATIGLCALAACLLIWRAHRFDFPARTPAD